MHKEQLELCIHINPDIKPGDLVNMWDGSSFTVNYLKHKDIEEIPRYIVNAYPELGITSPIKTYAAKVVATNIMDRVARGAVGAVGAVYLQDIIIEINGIQFCTASSMTRKINV